MSRPPEKPPRLAQGSGEDASVQHRGRIEAGFLLRRLQQGEKLPLPHSRPMPDVGKQCHELRVNDRDQTWRIVYHVADDAVVILDVFSKKTQAMPKSVIAACRERLAAYRAAVKTAKEQR